MTVIDRIIQRRARTIKHDESGGIVADVLLIAGLAVLAVAVVAGIVALVNGYLSEMPTSISG